MFLYTRMGIDSLWPRILRSEGDTYVEKGDPSDVKTIFVDGQVMLMKSTMPPHVTTWEQFVSFNFSSKIQRMHRSYEIVILSFDNYQVFSSVYRALLFMLLELPFFGVTYESP